MKAFILSFLLLLGLPTGAFATYHSQFGQDKYVNETYFKNHPKGVFVEIGAYDGVAFSDTLFFEKELGWTGLCVEPITKHFKECKKNRSCTVIRGCISDFSDKSTFLKVTDREAKGMDMLSGLLDRYDPRHLEMIKGFARTNGVALTSLPVQCYTFNELMEKTGISHVNFLSLDTEGGEYETLAAINFSRYKIDVITVEDNYNDPRIGDLLEKNGFVFDRKLGVDQIFVREIFKNRMA